MSAQAGAAGTGPTYSAGRRRVLVVTNDFPPRIGGIQSFVHKTLQGLDPAEVVVYASTCPGAEQFDAGLPFPVVRDRSTMLLPTPRVRRNVVAVLRASAATAVWFGAAAPLGLLAPALRQGGAQRIVATTHGHEPGWARLAVARSLLRRIAGDVDVLTYLGSYTRDRLSSALVDTDRPTRLERLTPGVDVRQFRPGIDATSVRARYELADAPTVVCVSRLVRRKGQDALIDAWPAIRAQVPDARLLLVGRGKYRDALERQAAGRSVSDSVTITGEIPDGELPAHLAAGDVFAMPCRTRRFGLDVEGLGIVYLEAGACGLPVIAGRSGGAPDAVLDGRTGIVVDGRSRTQITAAAVGLLSDPDRRQAMGRAGRSWVEQSWQWSAVSARLDALLQS